MMLPNAEGRPIPLIEGDIGVGAGGSAGGDQGWVVTVTSSAADPMADAAAALEGAGFTEDAAMSGNSVDARTFSDAEYDVVIAAVGDTVTYTVSPK